MEVIFFYVITPMVSVMCKWRLQQGEDKRASGTAATSLIAV